MNDGGLVMELICPTCRGPLVEGFFISNDREFSPVAFHCKGCKFVWDFVPKE